MVRLIRLGLPAILGAGSLLQIAGWKLVIGILASLVIPFPFNLGLMVIA